MSTTYWNRVRSDEMAVPTDRPLPDLTAELTTMLGSVDPVERDEIAYPILATWVSGGVYDDLLAGLGDGMAAGLTQGLGEVGTPSVFRPTRAMTRPSRRTGIVSTRTGTSSRHSGSPSRTRRPCW